MEEKNEVLSVLDLPQLYQRPSAVLLLSTLADLRIVPLSWDSVDKKSQQPRPKISSEGIPAYLTQIIASPLSWIEDDAQKEAIWEAASQRLSERSGRSAMGAITRTFTIPLHVGLSSSADGQNASGNGVNALDIVLHEPALTSDNLGFKTWASSYLLAKRLPQLRETFPTLPPDSQILELGAGTGLVGLAAAVIFKTHTLLTDLPEIVPNLEQNLLANSETLDELGGSAETAVLDWSRPDELIAASRIEPPQNSFLLIFAADPIYSSEHPQLLVQTIASHLRKNRDARVVIELPLREPFILERRDLRQRMEAIGLCILDEGREVGYDDWSDDIDGGQLTEVECWWAIWGWR